MRTFFPSRQVVSRETVRHRELALPEASKRQPTDFAIELDTPLPDDHAANAASGALARFVAGLDAAMRPMSRGEMEALGDPFSSHILLEGKNPQTVREVLEAISQIGQPRYSDRRLFLVAEGGQARLSSPQFEFNGRLVFVWQGDTDSKPDIMLSTVPAADDPQALLQLAAWSQSDRSFHFFERERSGGQWVWAGHSFHALSGPSRGKGPFDSHINGSLVMKELKEPWNHWHSVSATISPEAIPPGSELHSEPLFSDIRSAHELEPIVRTAIRRWTLSRLDADVRNGELHGLRAYLRQVLWCTSVNLVSSNRVFRQPVDGIYPLPSSFFYDFDAFAFLADRIDEDFQLVPGRLDVEAALYEQVVAASRIAVTDDSPNDIVVPGDTHFAFLVPERAFEDLAVLRELVQREALSPRTALCLLFVDFPNPVFSPRRGALLAYIEDTVALGDGGADFDARIVNSVRHAAGDAHSPEAEFLGLFDAPDLLTRCRDELAAFDASLRQRLRTAQGVAEIVDLAQSRRRVLADRRSLAEFRSTMAFGTNPREHLAMRADASIFVKTTEVGEGEN